MFASDFVIAVALSDLSDWLITDGYFVTELYLANAISIRLAIDMVGCFFLRIAQLY